MIFKWPSHTSVRRQSNVSQPDVMNLPPLPPLSTSALIVE